MVPTDTDWDLGVIATTFTTGLNQGMTVEGPDTRKVTFTFSFSKIREYNGRGNEGERERFRKGDYNVIHVYLSPLSQEYVCVYYHVEMNYYFYILS